MSQYNDLVQICLPTHNGEAHLAEALDSLLNQTHRNIEIVIMDNASTDGTAEIAQAYAERDSRIRYYRSEEFVCASENWNRAFEEIDPARSEFFMWASDDDLWDKNYIDELLEILKNEPSIVLAYSQFQNIDSDGSVTGERGYKSVWPRGGRFRRVRLAIESGQYSAIYGVIRLSAITWRPCLVDVSFGCDLWFLIRLCTAGGTEIVKKPLFFKRLGGISATNEDVSASREGEKVWLIERDKAAIFSLGCSLITKLYVYNRLKVSAKILYPERDVHPVLMPWVWFLILRSNRHAFGVRSRTYASLPSAFRT